MKTFYSICLLFLIPTALMAQVPKSDTVNVTVSGDFIEPAKNVYKDFSAEDMKIVNRLKTDVMMKTEDYDRKYNSGTSTLNSETKPE